MADRLYIQTDATFGRNRKVARVGLVGWVVFQHLLGCHRINPGEGWVSASESAPDAVCLGLAAFAREIDEPAVSAALERLESVGMIERDEEGNTFLPGWLEWSGPRSSTERSRRRREAMQRDATDATKCNAMQRTQRDATDATISLSSPLLSSPSTPDGRRKRERVRSESVGSKDPNVGTRSYGRGAG